MEINKEFKVAEPLKLEGTHNTRDIGLYITSSGQITRERQFLRSDTLHHLSENDVKFLKDYGVGCIIDLRSQMEREEEPCQEDFLRQVDYYSFPMLDQAASVGFTGNMPPSMGEVYVELLKNSADKFVEIMRVCVRYPNQTVLFHCSAGKDRTGVTAMLLLLLAKVDKQHIIEDYSVSEENMKEVFINKQIKFKKEYGVEIPEYVFSSAPCEIQKALEYLETNYSSVEEYLLVNGLEQDTIPAIQDKLLG